MEEDDDGGISMLLSISFPDLREMMAFIEFGGGFSETWAWNCPLGLEPLGLGSG